jgi:hypothetical protein
MNFPILCEVEMPQFENVSSKYGAPMGRREYNGAPQNKIRVFRVRIDAGGYDDGGAYWGIGKPLFCATDSADFRQFIRADSRLSAVAELGIEKYQLARPPVSEYRNLKSLENRGGISAGGIKLLQNLETLGF